MKYTTEYIYNKKIAVKFKTRKEAIKIINLMGRGNKLTWGGVLAESIQEGALSTDIDNGIIGRYNPKSEEDMTICWDGDSITYYQDNGFEIISCETFFEDNNEIIYEIY